MLDEGRVELLVELARRIVGDVEERLGLGPERRRQHERCTQRQGVATQKVDDHRLPPRFAVDLLPSLAPPPPSPNEEDFMS